VAETAQRDGLGTDDEVCRDQRPRRARRWSLAVASVGLVLAGCGLHVTKHGMSGNAFGHSFSGATGALPAGFPSAVPLPDHSRVMVGGGTGNDWNVTFAVAGPAATGAAAYQAKVQAAGYTVSNLQAGSAPVTPGSGSNATSTTVTVTGSVFTAKNAQWTMEVASGSTTSPGATGLKAGEFAINITLVPTSATPTS
jgi:hypothetical protein